MEPGPSTTAGGTGGSVVSCRQDSNRSDSDSAAGDETSVLSVPAQAPAAPHECGAATTSGQQGATGTRKRKRQRACDHCRVRKMKCDGWEHEDRVCALCRKLGLPCSYVMKSKKRNNRPRLSAARASKSVSFGGVEVSTSSTGGSSAACFDDRRELGRASDLATPRSSSVDRHHHHIMNATHQPPLFNMSDIDLHLPGLSEPSRIYTGESSTMLLAQDAGQLARGPSILPPSRQASSWPQHLPPAFISPPSPAFGSQPIWETPEYAERLRGRDFWPTDDLARGLLDFYFSRLHPVLPLFREDMFRIQFEQKAYVPDAAFANLCLMVFALAASHGHGDTRCRAPEDPQDLLSPQSHSAHSAGWTYYHQSTRKPRPRFKPASLHDMQISVLTAIFLSHSSVPNVAWTIIGEGMIFAKELGAHRAGVPPNDDGVEFDLTRRAFWCLVALDAELSAALGRPPHLALGSYDAPHPDVVVHGEPDQDLQAFSVLISAAELLRRCIETMYSIANQSRGKDWILQHMAALTGEIDAFQYSLPSELRWTAAQINDRLFHQATSIQLVLQSAKIYVTRLALPSPRTPDKPSMSSSFCDSCVSAALKISVLLDVQAQRSGAGLPLVSPAVQIGASVLAIVLFGGSRAGCIVDETALEEGLKRCQRVMRAAHELWLTAGMRSGWITALLAARSAAFAAQFAAPHARSASHSPRSSAQPLRSNPPPARPPSSSPEPLAQRATPALDALAPSLPTFAVTSWSPSVPGDVADDGCSPPVLTLSAPHPPDPHAHQSSLAQAGPSADPSSLPASFALDGLAGAPCPFTALADGGIPDFSTGAAWDGLGAGGGIIGFG